MARSQEKNSPTPYIPRAKQQKKPQGRKPTLNAREYVASKKKDSFVPT